MRDDRRTVGKGREDGKRARRRRKFSPPPARGGQAFDFIEGGPNFRENTLYLPVKPCIRPVSGLYSPCIVFFEFQLT